MIESVQQQTAAQAASAGVVSAQFPSIATDAAAVPPLPT